MICRPIPPHSIFILPAACVFALTTLAGLAPAAQVSATRLDGTTITGELRQWNASEILIASQAGEQRFDANQLISLRWQSATNSPTAAEKNFSLVELIDGSILPLKSIRIEKSNAALTLAAPAASGDKALTLPTQQLSAIRLRQLDAALTKQWDEMRHQNLANDVLAVLKKDGKSLDYVEGVMGDLSDDKIEFKLEGETQRVDRAKIAGVVYYRPDRRTKEESRATIEGRSGLRVSATHLELKDSQLNLTTAAGINLSWPLDDISFADYSAGKLMYLSDIEPASDKWTPFVGLPAAATLAAEYGKPRRDKSAYGGPLTLLMNERTREGEASAEPNSTNGRGSAGASPSLTAATTATKSFNKGLALRSRTEIVYRLPAGYRKLIALAGIDPATSSTGNVRLVISGDNRVLLESDIAGDQPPHPIQLEIADIKRLKILVDYGRNLDTGDWLNLCDARIVK
jgi:hypothetical protein